MEHHKAGTIQANFASRCDALMRIMVEQARKEDTWDIYLAKGAGDRAIAGDHEERHLLELLQNARDAIYRGRLEGDNAPGRVLVLVTERGMAVANTGAPFRLDQEAVLKAVRFLMRSDKTGHGFVGHKGIGLKSILLRAGAFAVYSQIDNEILRATFSRYRTAQHLLTCLDKEGVDAAQYHYVQAQLPRIPLFSQPHPDTVDTQTLGKDTQLIEALLDSSSGKHLGLTEAGVPGLLAPYTTVVYLPYRELEWEHLLNTLPIEDKYRQDFQRARAQMEQLSQDANADALWRELLALDSRVLVLLGEIAEVQLVRFRKQRLIEARRIEIAPPLFTLAGHKTSTSQTVQLHTHDWHRDHNNGQKIQSQTFIVLSAPTKLGVLVDEEPGAEEPPESIRILLEIPASDGSFQQKDEPLFLYYPIEASHSGLPFLIHGPFRVNSSRTALVPSQQEHNHAILEQAVELLVRSLPELLKSEHPLHRWLPWILLPLSAVEETIDKDPASLRAKLCKMVVTKLREQRCIPTTRGKVTPQEAHFLPEHPEALVFLEDLVVGRKKMRNHFYLLERENLATYQILTYQSPEHWQNATHAIGLGRIDAVNFAQELADQLGHISVDKPLAVDADQARAFFLSLCDLLSSKDSVRNRQVAGILGQNGVPLLPALPANGAEDRTQLFLIPAEAREHGGADLKQANRVVFWRSSSLKSRTSDLPVPPSSIPIYFIDPDVIETNGARAEGILSLFSYEWGTTRFESRPDLFRRVADRTAQLDSRTVTPVLGYLAGILYQVIAESFSGAEDLQPRPYAAINLKLLRLTLDYSNRSPAQRTLDRQRLESLQVWAQVQVPVKGGGTKSVCAEQAVFGPAWAVLLKQQARSDNEPDKEEDEPPEKGWAQAIRTLAAYRKAVGRRPNDADYPEIADPDDARWEAAWTQFARVVESSSKGETQIALFRLLLLLGVRIGPRVAWRWLNAGQKEAFDPHSRAVNTDISRQLYDDAMLFSTGFPPSLAQSSLLRTYCEFIALYPHHPAFAAEHSSGHRDHLRRTGNMESHLAAWTWLPDLEEVELATMPFAADLEAVDAFRETLLVVWEALSDDVLKTGWYCKEWHTGRTWQEKREIPSLAAFQISRLALWPAHTGGRLPDVRQQRFPAAVMVAWDQEDAPRATDPAGFFPLLDIYNNAAMAQVAHDLGIAALSDIDFAGAVLRLRWLLEKSRVDAVAPPGCWQIAELPGSSRDTWLAAQYRMLNRIVPHDPKSMWDQRTAQTCGLALRAMRGEEQIAVPVVIGPDSKPKFAVDVAFFEEAPRWWERRDNAGRWILETQSQLQTALYRWAEALGAKRLTQTRPPAYKGTPLATPEAEQAIADLRAVIQERMVYLLGVFKAHHTEKLEERAERLKAALSTMIAVEPDSDEEGWSGLNENQTLVFSLNAYKQRAEQHSGAIVLAEGIALLVEQTTAVGDLQHALSAPYELVERALKFQGVDLDVLVREISALEHRRMHGLLERVDELLVALRDEELESSPDWNLAGLPNDQWGNAIQQLKSLEGELADQALSAMAETAKGLSRAASAELLHIILDEERFAQGVFLMTRALLVILRKAGWAVGRRAHFAERYLGQRPIDLYTQNPICAQMLNRAVVAALVDQLTTGEWDSDLGQLPLDERARTLSNALLPIGPSESVLSFGRRLNTILKLQFPTTEAPLLLLELSDKDWEYLVQDVWNNARAALDKLPQAYQTIFSRCLQEGTIQPLEEQHIWHGGPRQSRIQALEHQLEQGELVFEIADLLDLSTNAALNVEALRAVVSEPGQSTGGSELAAVTEDQAIRGRVAELFVLEVCWQRYLCADRGTREQMLTVLNHHREHGAGDVPWGTKAAWKSLQPRLSDAWNDLLICTAEDNTARTLFKDLIEVTNERGPGFDVLDPFGVWGQPYTDMFTPCRVEIKAILPPMAKNSEHRVILSTNEFHRARQHPSSYVLRLIYVPSDYEDLRNVHWAVDIPNPVQTLHLDEKIVLGVRSGILPFVVYLG